MIQEDKGLLGMDTWLFQGKIGFLFRFCVGTEKDLSIHLTVDFLDHLALASTTGTFVHDGDDIVVGSNDPGGGTVGGNPTFLLPISCTHNRNIDDFLDCLLKVLTRTFRQTGMDLLQ